MTTVFFDVDTQLDFLYPAGALYVPGAERIVEKLDQLTRFAAGTGIQVISTADAHGEDDPEFRTWKSHCVAGTVGQAKTSVSLLGTPLILSTDEDGWERVGPQVATQNIRQVNAAARQIVVEKQKLDCFTNPHLVPLLRTLVADRYVLYGVVTELCVSCAAFGLLETGARVELVQDAVQGLDSTEEQAFLRRFLGRGGTLTSVARVISNQVTSG